MCPMSLDCPTQNYSCTKTHRGFLQHDHQIFAFLPSQSAHKRDVTLDVVGLSTNLSELVALLLPKYIQVVAFRTNRQGDSIQLECRMDGTVCTQAPWVRSLQLPSKTMILIHACFAENGGQYIDASLMVLQKLYTSSTAGGPYSWEEATSNWKLNMARVVLHTKGHQFQRMNETASPQ